MREWEYKCDHLTIYVSPAFPESIILSGPDGVMAEGEEHKLTCYVHNVAPVKKLVVRWYKGDTVVHSDTFDGLSQQPENQSSILSFTPSRRDNGGKFRCEAHLDLGPEGPRLNVSSHEYTVTVSCKYWGEPGETDPVRMMVCLF